VSRAVVRPCRARRAGRVVGCAYLLCWHEVPLSSQLPSGTPTHDPTKPLVERDIERWFSEQLRRRERRRQVCASKRWFATESEARAAALWDRTQYGTKLSCYRCEECDGWHLTGGRGGGGGGRGGGGERPLR